MLSTMLQERQRKRKHQIRQEGSYKKHKDTNEINVPRYLLAQKLSKKYRHQNFQPSLKSFQLVRRCEFREVKLVALQKIYRKRSMALVPTLTRLLTSDGWISSLWDFEMKAVSKRASEHN